MYQLFFMTKWFCFLFISAGFTVVVAVVADDNNKLTASLCNTCPAICNPSPPSNSNSKPPPPLVTTPPAVKSKPPPPTPVLSHAPPPPRFYYFDSPGVAPPLPKPSPPPAYVSSGGTGSNGGAPPPPRLVYLPSSETPGGGVSGQTNYPYPYYMYDSKAADDAFSIGFLLLVSFHVTLILLV